MKALKTWAAMTAILGALLYLAGAFNAASLVIEEWPMALRGIVAWIWVGGSLVMGVAAATSRRTS